MEKLIIKPIGDISPSYDWGTNELTFETGSKQFQQRYTEPDTVWSFKFSGLYSEYIKLRDFFNARKAQVEKFKMEIEGKEEVVRFATSKINPKIKRELGVPVGYECELAIRKVKED